MVGKHTPLTVAFLTAVLMVAGVKAQQALAQQASPYGVTRQPYNSTLGSQSQTNYTVLYVDPLMGDDVFGTGTPQQPFKTITQALATAQAGTVVVLAPGRYTAETGETFPLRLKPGVTLQGNPNTGQSAIIYGGGNFQSATLSHQNAAILTSDRSGLGYVVVSNPHTQGHGVWVESGSPVIRNNAFVANRHTGVYIAGGAPNIEGNYFNQNQVAGLVIYGNARGSIRGNHFEDTGTAITVATTAAPEIVGNRILRNNEGIVLLGNAQPTLANNDISQNRRNGVVEVASTAPPIQVAAGAELTSLQLTPAPDRASSSEPSVNSRESVQAVAVRPAPIAQPLNDSTAIAPTATAPTPVTSNPSDSAPPLPLLPETSSPNTVASVEPTIEPETAIPPASAAASLATTDITSSPESPPQVSLQALRERLENRTIAAVTVAAPAASTPTTSSPTPSHSPTPDTSAVTVPAPDLPRTPATATPAAPAADLARLPSLPSTNRLDAPQVSPSGQTAAARPALSNPEVSEPPATNPAETTAEEPNRVSIADLRNRLLSRQSSASSETTSTASTNPTEPESVAIAVIPAATPSRPTPQPAAATNPQLPNSPSATSGPSYRIPVPGARIPVGGGGRAIAINSLSTPSGEGGPPPLPSRASALGLYYRVFVEGTDGATQQRLRELVPDAFRTQLNGRAVMQAGAYPDEVTAQERLQMLLDNGLNARMEYIP